MVAELSSIVEGFDGHTQKQKRAARAAPFAIRFRRLKIAENFWNGSHRQVSRRVHDFLSYACEERKRVLEVRL